jgi:hypothetical protein
MRKHPRRHRSQPDNLSHSIRLIYHTSPIVSSIVLLSRTGLNLRAHTLLQPLERVLG